MLMLMLVLGNEVGVVVAVVHGKRRLIYGRFELCVTALVSNGVCVFPFAFETGLSFRLSTSCVRVLESMKRLVVKGTALIFWRLFVLI